MNETKHTTICAGLRSRIRNGELNGRLKSMEELARDYGVATLTMRKALKTLKDENLIRTEPGNGTFVVEPKKSANGLIGLVMEQTLQVQSANFYAMGVMMGLQAAFSRSGFSLLFLGRIKEILTEGIRQAVDGLCLYEVFNDSSTDYMTGFAPVVAIEGIGRADGFDSIRVDNRQLGRLAAQILIEKDLRRALYIGVDIATRKDPAWLERLEGFRDAFDGSPSRTAEYLPLTRNPESTCTELTALLSGRTDFDSVVINNGMPAKIVYELCPHLTPDAIVAFGTASDADLLDCVVVGADFYALGEQAGQLMIRRLRTPDAPFQSILVPGERL